MIKIDTDVNHLEGFRTMDLEKCIESSSYSPDGQEPPAIGSFPYYTSGDSWKSLSSSGMDDWVTGFWTGIHWIGHDAGHVNKSDAIELTRKIKLVHEKNFNTGFRFQYSWVPAYEATGRPKFKRKALKGAERLSRCFSPELSLVVHNGNDRELISTGNDALMNIPLLLWAINHTPESGEYRRHLEDFLSKAIDLFVKPNGSVRHRIHYDPDTLSIERVDTHQGIPGGCWARGLAWTVYGLTLGGIFLNNEKFIDTAKTVMDYHRENSSKLVPPFDYSVSTLNQPELTDTSAGAIMACAMLTLGKLRNNDQAKNLGRQMTEQLFRDYRRGDDQDGLIDGGCYHYHKDKGVNEATVWGDFYALEALYILRNNELPSHLSWLQSTRRSRAKAS